MLCTLLSVNTLKWSESFMGNPMMYNLRCKYEEPLRRTEFDFDCPNVLLFRVASNDYSFSPTSNTNHIRRPRIEFRDYDMTSILIKMKGLVQGKTLFCLRGLSINDLPKRLDTCQYVGRRAIDWANDTSDASGILWSDVISDIWSSNSHNLMRNENDKITSFEGLFGSCFCWGFTKMCNHPQSPPTTPNHPNHPKYCHNHPPSPKILSQSPSITKNIVTTTHNHPKYCHNQ